MKRSILIIGLVAALSLVFVGSAFANFGPHGGYAEDTDSCAGCHRAHSSFSTVRYTPRVGGELLAPNEKPFALLVGSASTMTEFCNACHGDAAPGASTNVVSGLFDGGPSASATQTAGVDLNDGVATAYQTDSLWGAPLNGGGFSQVASIVDFEADAAAAYEAVTSTHSMEKTGVLWGAGSSVSGETMDLTCTSCHDPHGSSNYRLLKDSVNSNTVGGYALDGTPAGIVFSVEDGYDAVYATGGWLKGESGHTQMVNYEPNYTSGSSDIRAGSAGDSMSAWCSGCHEDYDEQSSDYDYGSYEGFQNGGTGVGSQTRHRHPVDMELKAGDANLMVVPQADGVLDRKIPLEPRPDGDTRDGHVGCLTCHYAHGSNAVMTGWSAAHLEEINGIWSPVRDSIAGVEPDKADVVAIGAQAEVPGTSALLRADERGVCQRCHDK